MERETGVPAASLAEMARLLRAAGGRVALYPANGLEHHENGVDNIRAILSLNALLGALGKVGGSLFAPPLPLRDLTLYDERPLTELEPLGADRFPVLYEVRRECHTMTALNGILTGEPYPLRAMLLAGGNPALTNPNSKKVVAGALGARAAGRARPVHDRDGRPRGLRPPGRLVPGAQRGPHPS